LTTVKLNKTLGERIFEKLKEDILSGVYKPGDRLRYTEIASELQVSMTPVKEALLRLEQEGLVMTMPRKGTFVTGITDHDIGDYMRIRLALEQLAADMICERKIPPENIQNLDLINAELDKAIAENRLNDAIAKDVEFHSTLIALSDSKRLVDITKQLSISNIQALRGRTIAAVTVDMHNDIIAALCKHDARRAKRCLHINILNPTEKKDD
jgi:DNA-binding GntR family transcriptional regulator